MDCAGLRPEEKDDVPNKLEIWHSTTSCFPLFCFPLFGGTLRWLHISDSRGNIGHACSCHLGSPLSLLPPSPPSCLSLSSLSVSRSRSLCRSLSVALCHSLYAMHTPFSVKESRKREEATPTQGIADKKGWQDTDEGDERKCESEGERNKRDG